MDLQLTHGGGRQTVRPFYDGAAIGYKGGTGCYYALQLIFDCRFYGINNNAIAIIAGKAWIKNILLETL